MSEMLTMQYRMNAGIMDWSSRELYAGRLAAHESVAAHTLAGLPGGGLGTGGREGRGGEDREGGREGGRQGGKE